MDPADIAALLLATPGGTGGAGAGIRSITGWVIAVLVVLLLAAIGWWSTTRGRRR